MDFDVQNNNFVRKRHKCLYTTPVNNFSVTQDIQYTNVQLKINKMACSKTIKIK